MDTIGNTQLNVAAAAIHPFFDQNATIYAIRGKRQRRHHRPSSLLILLSSSLQFCVGYQLLGNDGVLL